MTRPYVYYSALVAFVAATAMTIASIAIPNWISYSSTSVDGETYSKHIGLHKTCSDLNDPPCRVFPTEDQCQGDERYFCGVWRTMGFLASFATVIYLAGIVSFVVVMAGGKFKREVGWKVLSPLLLLAALVEFVIMGVVVYIYNNDDQFTVPGWGLDTSWFLCTVSASIAVLCSVGLLLSAYLLPPEDDYEFLQDPVS
ncbi:hypothetical protein SODALDRAFT_271516 [Sodiomyces alkalinus F11]|uniref:Pre-mRNA splicing factor n=1 Tax=Sodiomyces alkalinus (strain CBS 110278 / VKM F-3762 / F11) TaxID=1314773 RepID=A0A3N2Q3W7_SODAK|nr:hypothetical protein SODALDRAFT_271516 [Sodiomyces alkalinus F11]ROT41407.1 hypothetical protein SODALDRAFT_271516 [Sodiomyces alkalinus F11]